MGKVRWTGWVMATAMALVVSGGLSARADVASDKPAAILVYPKIIVDSTHGIETDIRLTNTNLAAPVILHCFYANHTNPKICVSETDFNIVLTPGQPIKWDAALGLPGFGSAPGQNTVPLQNGVCIGNQAPCFSNFDCQFPPSAGGFCTPSNLGTSIPPVSSDPFFGELRCIEVDVNGAPVASNDVKGEAIIETEEVLDFASYNAIGIQATGNPITAGQLTLGPQSSGEYNGCPGILILNNFFDNATDPIDHGDGVDPVTITTDLTLIPCSIDYLNQTAPPIIVQYLVFNEFEQRLSTSNTVNCFFESLLSKIDTSQVDRSIFSAGVQGTLTGQTRMNPIGGGLLGVAIEDHAASGGNGTHSAAFNLHFAGPGARSDMITLP